VPLSALVERNPEVDFAETDDLMMGCGFQAGEQGMNVGRNALLLSGIDHHVPATTVNRFCASSLQTLRMAFHAISAGEGDQYIAAGVEAVSRFGDSPVPFHPQLDGSEGSIFNVYIPMGQTAENVAERCKVSRESQDEWAATSQQRAVAACDSGHFDREIVAVTLEDGTEVTRDDGPGPGTTVEKLAELKPAFRPDGTVTAGNACPLNEAFAAQVVPCRDEWGIDPEKLNPFGGAIALGHPFGMTGARIMTTLLNDLDTLDGTIGLETMCVAGGMGQAMIVERLN
jgi:acetyl-CoA C-acetyltransferase